MTAEAPEETSAPPPGPVVAVIHVFARGGEFGYDIDTDLGPEIMESVLRQAADIIGGKNDRAAGAWGRS